MSEDHGAQSFADDDEDRIVGLDMPWQYAERDPPYRVRAGWRREAKYELRHCIALRAALEDGAGGDGPGRPA